MTNFLFWVRLNQLSKVFHNVTGIQTLKGATKL